MLHQVQDAMVLKGYELNHSLEINLKQHQLRVFILIDLAFISSNYKLQYSIQKII